MFYRHNPLANVVKKQITIIGRYLRAYLELRYTCPVKTDEMSRKTRGKLCDFAPGAKYADRSKHWRLKRIARFIRIPGT